MSNVYYLEKNVLNEEECLALSSLIDANSVPERRFNYRHFPILLWDILASDGIPSELEPVRRAIKIANETFIKNYVFTYNRFELKRLFGNIMDQGSINEAHDDDGDIYPGKKDVEEHYSCILMLNSDYEGGELYFEHHGIEIKLEAGDLIMFRGNAKNLHGVRKVLSGKRVNVVIFFRNFNLEVPYIQDIWQEFIQNKNSSTVI